MTVYYRTRVTAVGPEVGDLLEGGVLILYADGAPPELAEVSVLHAGAEMPQAEAPPVGATLSVGDLAVPLTAIGERAWAKVADMGHVVVNFNGSDIANRPGELCAAATPAGTLIGALVSGATISIVA